MKPPDACIAVGLLVLALAALIGVLALFGVPLTEGVTIAVIGSFFLVVRAVVGKICMKCSR